MISTAAYCPFISGNAAVILVFTERAWENERFPML